MWKRNTATEKTKLIRSTGIRKIYIYYYCTRKKRGSQCQSRKVITVKELEDQIESTLDGLTINRKVFEIARLIINSNEQLLQIQGDVIAKAQEKELANTEKERKKLLQLRLHDLLTDSEFQQEKQAREIRIKQIKQSMEEIKNEPRIVAVEVEKKFASLVNLKTEFKNASCKGRKSILLNIGRNHSLNGKILNINKAPWLQAIESKRKEVEAEISWLELEKYIDSNTFSVYFKDMFPQLRALIDEVGTEITKEMRDRETDSQE